MDKWENQEPIRFVTYKIDGVNVRLVNGVAVSRSDKPLKVPHWLMKEGYVYEVFAGDWSKSISAIRGTIPFKVEYLYSLHPVIDPRLHAPSANLDEAVALGYEGLVINGKYKLKPTISYDVIVIGIEAGKGRHQGRMGALITSMGKVGTGFSDEDRERTDWLGKVIEVECQQLTKDGKFRNPAYVRERWDKVV